jgi:hypothetical protein
MKQLRNIEWKNYRHPEFLQTLTTKELKYIKLFLRKGTNEQIGELIEERKGSHQTRLRRMRVST